MKEAILVITSFVLVLSILWWLLRRHDYDDNNQESYFKEYKASLEKKGSDWYLAYGSGEGDTLIPIDLYMGVDPASSLSIKMDDTGGM